MSISSDMLTFAICLLIGGGVLLRYCAEQFDKPSQSKSENDPWPFIVPKFLASRTQYLMGFSVYFGILLLIFIFCSLLFYFKPDVARQILVGLSGAKAVGSEAAADSGHAESSYLLGPTSPLVVAFWLVGLNPHLPSFLDVELFVRKLGHRLAYIPNGMNDIFVFMRYAGYSDFIMPEQELKEAWNEIGVRPLTTKIDELKPAIELMNHVAFLYGRAATLAGDLSLTVTPELRGSLDIDVFRAYRADIQRVLTELQAAHGRIAEQIANPAEDHSQPVQQIQRDLNHGLEFLYTLFACAITAKGTDQLGERLRVFGVTTPYPPPPQIPWNPILKVSVGSGVFLAAGWLLAAQTFLANSMAAVGSGVPNHTGDIVVWLLIAFFVQIAAMASATRMRTRLMDRNKYFSPTGSVDVTAYAKIVLQCAWVSFLCYLGLNVASLIKIVLMSWGAPAIAYIGPLINYLQFCAAWTLVPTSCGLMTAYTLDLSCDTPLARLRSGALEAVVMSCMALLAVESAGSNVMNSFRLFNILIYGGLGFVFGYLLPEAITRHRKALENRLPDRIAMLRSAVFRNFLDTEDFYRWLQTSNAKLGGRRPLDALGDDTGLQSLIDFVRTTRSVPAAPAAP